MDRPRLVTLMDSSATGVKPDSLRRSAGDRLEFQGVKEGARGGTTGSPTLEGGEDWIGRGS